MSNSDSSPTPTADLLRLYQSAGSEDALRQLIQRYLPLVHATARRRTGSESLAADVAQTVLIDFARQARSMPLSVQIGGWLLRHTGFRASRALRTERRRASREAEALRRSQLHPPAMNDDDPDHSPLAAALHRLPAPEQSLLILKFYEGLEIPEIAAQLGISAAAAQKRTERALQHLRRLLPATAGIPGAPSTAAVALSLSLGALLSRPAQAAALPPPPLTSKWTAKALSAAAASPMPAPLVRLRHLSTGAGTLLGAAAALALSAAPVWISWDHRPPAVTLAAAPLPEATTSLKTEAAADIDDVFAKLKALVDREGRNRLTWRKAESLIQSLPQTDSEEAMVRLDGMFAITHLAPPSNGPDEWFSRLLKKWNPSDIPEALCRLLPRLHPVARDYVAQGLCWSWYQKSPSAATEWLQVLLADNDHKLLPEDARRNLVTRLACQVTKNLLISHPEEARALGDQLAAGGFENIQQYEVRHLKTGTERATREAIQQYGHPWYLPVMDVLEKDHTPEEKRALTDKIGDPGVRQTLAELLSENLFAAARESVITAPQDAPSSVRTDAFRQIRETADWLLDQTPAARRGQVLGSIAQGWLQTNSESPDAWFERRAPDATAILDQSKSFSASGTMLTADESAERALSIKDPELRDYTLAARLGSEADGSADSSILSSPKLPPAAAAALRHWLSISP